MRGAETGQLTWIARDGAMRSVTPDIRSFGFPRLSPDGRRIAVIVKDAGTEKTDVWVYDLGTATLSRVTSLESVSNFEWARDGNNLVVTSAATQDRSAIWLQPVGGGVAPTKLGELAELTITAALARDGSALLATVLHENTWAVMRIPLAPKGAPSVFVDTKGTDWGPRFSPDGKWVALTSEESGRYEVYIRSYPEPSARVQVSDAGGGSPSWSPDGKRLYYNGGGAVVGARLELAPTLQVVARDTIFRGFGELDAAGGAVANFDVAADGSRAVVVRPTSTSSQLVASPNWIVEFRQRMAEANRKK
jgi:Tol biopolymer transport system component